MAWYLSRKPPSLLEPDYLKAIPMADAPSFSATPPSLRAQHRANTTVSRNAYARIFLSQQIPTTFALSTNDTIIGKCLSTSCENVKNVPLLSVYSVLSNVGDVPDVREAAGASRTPESPWNSMQCFTEEPDSTAQGAARVHAQGVRG